MKSPIHRVHQLIINQLREQNKKLLEQHNEGLLKALEQQNKAQAKALEQLQQECKAIVAKLVNKHTK